MTLFQIMKKTATLNWNVFSVRRITNLCAVSLLASSLGSLRVRKDWWKRRSSPFPVFSPSPSESFLSRAKVCLVNQSISINHSTSLFHTRMGGLVSQSGYVKSIDCCRLSQSCAKGIVLCAYTHSQNAPVELWTRYRTNFFREWFLQE